MSTINISANGKGTDFYLRNFYGQSQDFRKAANRSGVEKSALTLADTQALKRALREIGDSTKEEEEDTAVEVSAFIQTYNNLLESTEDLDDSEIKSLRKKIKSLTKNMASDLDNIGITVSDSGELKIRNSRLQSASHENIMKVFGSDSSFKKKIQSYQKRLSSAAEDYNVREINQRNKMKSAYSIDIYA